MKKQVAGFQFAGVAAGIKAQGDLDLGWIACDRPVPTAAVFTKNKAAAAPVHLSRRRLRASKGMAQAIVVNSGNANACTGKSGASDAKRMSSLAARAAGIDERHVLVASTGVIGERLPMAQLGPAIEALPSRGSPRGFQRFAKSILTTDLGPKSHQVTCGSATLLGCTKGAGMIAPNMATTLSFVVTDAAIGPGRLARALQRATELTYNTISVDGDTSTNDMIAVMASGRASGRRMTAAQCRAFEVALTELLETLARKLMKQGEGVHHVVDICVSGCSSERAARRIAMTVANSPLVKTAIAGRDPNWGRILAAAGRAEAPMRLAQVDLSIGSTSVVAGGEPRPASDWEAKARRVMARPAYSISLSLGRGPGSARALACDLSHEYVRLNADYRS